MQRMYPDFFTCMNDCQVTQQRTALPPSSEQQQEQFPMEMTINDHLRSMPSPPPWLVAQEAVSYRHSQDNDMLRIGQPPKMHLPQHQQTPSGSLQHVSNRYDARVPSSSDTSSSSCSPTTSENLHNALQNALGLDPSCHPSTTPLKQEPLDDYSINSMLAFGCPSSSETQTPSRRSRSTSEGMMKCQFCPKKFTTPQVLEGHMRECQLIRVHECAQCGKRFKARGGLQQHMRIHNNDRPYACHFCTKRFTQKSHVDQHERIHTGAKPFVCQYCGRAFRQRSQQLGHEATHIHATQDMRGVSGEVKPLIDVPSIPSQQNNQAITGLLALSQQPHAPLMGGMPMFPDFESHGMLEGQMM